MAAKYDLYKNPSPKGKAEEQLMHARFVPYGKVTADELYKLAANGNTFTPGEIHAMLECVIDTVINQLEFGKVVEFGSLGTISMTLDSRPVMKKSEIRSQSVCVKNLTLKVSKVTKRRIHSIELERNPYGWQSHQMEPEEIERRLTEYFAKNFVMRSPDYCHLRKCKRCMGIKELNAFIAEGRLCRNGRGCTTIYIPTAGNFGR